MILFRTKLAVIAADRAWPRRPEPARLGVCLVARTGHLTGVLNYVVRHPDVKWDQDGTFENLAALGLDRAAIDNGVPAVEVANDLGLFLGSDLWTPTAWTAAAARPPVNTLLPTKESRWARDVQQAVSWTHTLPQLDVCQERWEIRGDAANAFERAVLVARILVAWRQELLLAREGAEE